MRWIALALVLVGGWLVGCARRDDASPVVRLPDASSASSGGVGSAPTTSVASVIDAPGAATAERPPPLPGSCEARGLRTFNPCADSPIVVSDPDSVSEAQELAFCCEGVPPESQEGEEPCFNTLQWARACKSAAGEARVQARIAEVARRFGEPCLRPWFRAKFSWSQRYAQLCSERGYP